MNDTEDFEINRKETEVEIYLSLEIWLTYYVCGWEELFNQLVEDCISSKPIQ